MYISTYKCVSDKSWDPRYHAVSKIWDPRSPGSHAKTKPQDSIFPGSHEKKVKMQDPRSPGSLSKVKNRIHQDLSTKWACRIQDPRIPRQNLICWIQDPSRSQILDPADPGSRIFLGSWHNPGLGFYFFLFLGLKIFENCFLNVYKIHPFSNFQKTGRYVV